MITKDQAELITRQAKTNTTTVYREYLQLLFLSRLYSYPKSKNIFFKGGTALRFILGASRFSEDLDFTVMMAEKPFLTFISEVFESFAKEEEVEYKERKTIAGKRFLLTAKLPDLNYKIFINLDFSFREKVIDPQKSIIKTNYPVLFTSFVHHLSKEEILAEKIRAIMTRKAGRDIYDLWFLLAQKTAINEKIIQNKLKYYNINTIKKEDILKRINEFSSRDFVLDLRPFVPINEREKLDEFFLYVKDFLRQNLKLSDKKEIPGQSTGMW